MPVEHVLVDGQGLDPAALSDRVGLVIATPSHNIPTGATQLLARRLDPLRRADAQDFLVIEDDYEFEMSFLELPCRR